LGQKKQNTDSFVRTIATPVQIASVPNRPIEHRIEYGIDAFARINATGISENSGLTPDSDIYNIPTSQFVFYTGLEKPTMAHDMAHDMAGRTNNVNIAIPNCAKCIVSAGSCVRVRRDKGFAIDFGNEACSDFGSLAGVFGATLMEPVIAE